MQPIHADRRNPTLLRGLLALTFILLVVVVVTDVEDGWFGEQEEPAHAVAATGGTATPARAEFFASAPCLNESQLRRIVREELATAHPANFAAAQTPDRRGSTGVPPATGLPSIEFENLDRQVDDYIRTGAISEAQMIALQAEMARLDPESRKKIFQKVVGAMNSGRLAGNL